ncbi:hypothetical protein [Polymorphobacter megasporae]|uniref:hypothetical protein n=1 Tax=Glacieibacterium megasporae TaxID=2835787 RepID=UPI001C1E4A86|nr:hypothetical protein [Polymorphobacter megasporae]UAJ12408.1 hypothetical protein KTC28_21610 [Polymorphobacter megasporae]
MVPFDSLTDAVGPKAPNRPVDVALIQDLVALANTGKPGDCVDGLMTDELLAGIGTFQTATMKSAAPDRKVDPGGRTFTALLAAAGKSYKGPLIFLQLPLGPWNLLDRTRFSDLFALQFKDPQPYNWTSPRPVGLRTVLDSIIADAAITDLRWAADMMATVQRETGRFTPVEEGGRGAGKPYGKPMTFTAADKKKYTNIYYGRGYVQLTHLENYVKMGDLLGRGETLAMDPGKALEPSIAYNVMSYGMRNGSFTTAAHKLSDYMVGTKCDYREARRIINGVDMANEIANCAEMIEGLLWLSTRACFGSSIFKGAGMPKP